MRTALIADIHANREALDAVLDDVARVGVDRIVCLGDIVGYGPDPEACVEAVARLVSDGAVAVLGNHDEAIARGSRGMSENAARAIEWTASRLGPHEREFLAALPLVHADGDVLLVHASADEPADWTYVTSAEEAAESLAATDARLILSGHTHMPALFNTLHGVAGSTGKTITFRPQADKPVPLTPIRRYHAVIGSVGQPRDGDPRACWGLLDSAARELTWRRVAYDVDRTMRKIMDAGLPERLASRLARGN